MLSRATAVTAEKERSSPSQALVHTLGGDVCVEGVPRAPPEPVHEGRQLRQSPSSISAKKLAEISGHRQRAREGSRHVNEGVYLFLLAVVERLQVLLHRPVRRIYHSELVSRKESGSLLSYEVNRCDVLHRLADDLEGIGAGVHVDHVHPLLCFDRLVSCTRKRASNNIKRRICTFYSWPVS